MFQTENGAPPAEPISCVQFEDTPSVREYAPNVPAELEEVVRKCLVKKPKGRPASARELSLILSSVERSVWKPQRSFVGDTFTSIFRRRRITEKKPPAEQ
jgi:hypothetical protein